MSDAAEEIMDGGLEEQSPYKYAISVIVPVYNGEANIRQTLDSLLVQTFDDIQIVCVDDGSTDGTAAILSDISASEPRLKVVSTENRGVYKAREAGIEASDGEYIGFCDCGDAAEPDMFSSLHACAKRNAADIVVCGYKRICDSAVIAEEMQQGAERVAEVDAGSGWLAAVNTSLWNKLVRADILQYRVRLDDSPRVMEDAMLLFSLYPFVKRMAFLPTALYRYNTVGGSAMSRVEPDELSSLFDDWQTVREHAMRNNARFERIIDVAVFVHMGISAPLRLLQNKDPHAKQSIRAISERLTDDFPTLTKSPFLGSLYAKGHPSMKSVRLAYMCWRAHLLVPALKMYAALLARTGKGISW